MKTEQASFSLDGIIFGGNLPQWTWQNQKDQQQRSNHQRGKDGHQKLTQLWCDTKIYCLLSHSWLKLQNTVRNRLRKGEMTCLIKCFWQCVTFACVELNFLIACGSYLRKCVWEKLFAAAPSWLEQVKHVGPTVMTWMPGRHGFAVIACGIVLQLFH